MSKDLNECRISLDQTLLDAVRAIDQSALGIALVMDDEDRLCGTLTDGDIRRVILRGVSLEADAGTHMQKDFIVVGSDAARADVLDLMQARLVDQIPVVDENKKLLGLHTIHGIIGAQDRPNMAVIMAGGKGSRLYPLTDDLPKPMIKVAGRPILERLVLHLASFGIRHISIAINYKADVIEKHFGDGSSFGCMITYLREDEPLGSGGALSLLDTPPEDPLLVLNGDIVTDVKLDELLAFHTNGRYAATMAVRRYMHGVPFGCVEVEDGQILRLAEKPYLSRLINTGIYVLSPELVRDVPKKYFPITQMFDQCIEKKQPVGAFQMEGDWIDVGQHQDLLRAQLGENE